jgi:frataxin-like iron-binding protein CyaY
VIAVADLSAVARSAKADVAQLAERVLGKDEVTGSIPVIGSSLPLRELWLASELVGCCELRLASRLGRSASVGWLAVRQLVTTGER